MYTYRQLCSGTEAMREFSVLTSQVAHATLSTPPTYAEIMLLDEKVRIVCRKLPEESQPASIPPLSGCTFLESVLLTLFVHFTT
jgi:hypothetical protein